jgi:hypothetical protein
MDKNIAAILREDAKTCSVKFPGDNGIASGSSYTYVTHFPLEVGDLVVIPDRKSVV